jgi:hypothetical protein
MTDNQAGNDYRCSEAGIKESIARWLSPERIPKQIRTFTDTSDFFRIDYDDVAILGGKPYFIRNNEREGRFGIDEQQKFWVKKAVDLTDGSVKIIKLTFHERFEANVGDLRFECFRSPQKEAHILELVRNSDYFMQGFSVKDAAGNIVRILDFIKGKTFADYVLTIGKDHHDYYHSYFPGVLDEYIELVQAIKFLHDNGEKHGDIRRDHIIRERETGKCRWIDFDFNYLHRENMFSYDLFGLGNILVYLAGKGDVTVQNLKQENSPAYDNLLREDMNIIFNNRVVNLKKVYPYIADSLNLIMLHFSLGANTFYDDTGQLLNDLYEVRSQLS